MAMSTYERLDKLVHSNVTGATKDIVGKYFRLFTQGKFFKEEDIEEVKRIYYRVFPPVKSNAIYEKKTLVYPYKIYDQLAFPR